MAMVIETVADVGVADACEQGEHGLLAQAGAGQPAFRHFTRRHGHGQGAH
jgi:hypothetical protein